MIIKMVSSREWWGGGSCFSYSTFPHTHTQMRAQNTLQVFRGNNKQLQESSLDNTNTDISWLVETTERRRIMWRIAGSSSKMDL